MRHALITLLVLAVVGGCSSSPSPVLPPATLTPVSNEISIQKQWRRDFGNGAGDHYLQLKPVLNGQVLYVADYQGKLIAYDTATKKTVWEQNLETPVASALTIEQGKLLFGTSDGDVFALDAKSGGELWRARVSSEVLAPPVAANGMVVVRCVNGQLYGLDSADGKQRWVIDQRTPALTLRGTSAPVIAGDIVLAAFDNGQLMATSLQSGRLLWQASIAVPRGRTDIERMVDIDANPVVRDDVVYAVAYQGRIAAVQLGSGRIIWARDVDSYTGMAVDSYRIYLTDSQGQVWALDRTTGATLWKQDALLRRSVTKPVIQKQYVVVADFNGFVHWIRRDTGAIAARVRLQAPNYRNPDLDETEDRLFPKSNNILVPPLVEDNVLIAMERYGLIEAFEITVP